MTRGLPARFGVKPNAAAMMQAAVVSDVRSGYLLVNNVEHTGYIEQRIPERQITHTILSAPDRPGIGGDQKPSPLITSGAIQQAQDKQAKAARTLICLVAGRLLLLAGRTVSLAAAPASSARLTWRIADDPHMESIYQSPVLGLAARKRKVLLIGIRLYN